MGIRHVAADVLLDVNMLVIVDTHTLIAGSCCKCSIIVVFPTLVGPCNSTGATFAATAAARSLMLPSTVFVITYLVMPLASSRLAESFAGAEPKVQPAPLISFQCLPSRTGGRGTRFSVLPDAQGILKVLRHSYAILPVGFGNSAYTFEQCTVKGAQVDTHETFARLQTTGQQRME